MFLIIFAAWARVLPNENKGSIGTKITEKQLFIQIAEEDKEFKTRENPK